MINVIAALAEGYPRGLVAINKTNLDGEFIRGLYHQAQMNGYFFEDNEPSENGIDKDSFELPEGSIKELSN